MAFAPVTPALPSVSEGPEGAGVEYVVGPTSPTGLHGS